MSNNMNDNKPKINIPRPNLSWLYVLIAVFFLFLYISSDEGGVVKQVSYTEFKEIVNKGYADKIVAYDDNTAEVFIKPDHVVDVFKNDAKRAGKSPAVNVQVGSTSSWRRNRRQDTLPVR